MYDFGRPYGESCYRLMSRTGQFIYLKTRGCLEVDDKTRQVHSFVCVNSLVSDDEGRRLIREMKKKFSAIISEAELSAMESDVPAVENPQNLERAILNLITNLNNAASYDDDNASMISDSTVEEENRRTKSPPLAIIPPKQNTIKQSIFNAVAVIGHTSKGKSPNVKDEPKSPDPTCQLSPQASPQQNIKDEPTNILSPSSSISSDSDRSSPFLSSSRQRHVKPIVDNSNEIVYVSSNNNSSKSEDYPSHFNSLPGYGTGATDALMASTTSISVVNNNNSSVNRNSVLKRTYLGEDEDYPVVVKKRTFSAHSPAQATPNTPLDLMMNTSGAGKIIKH